MKTTNLYFDSIRNNYLYFLRQKTPIHISNIILLEAKINYTNIYLKNGKKIMLAKTLKSFEELLFNHHFYRIHRAFLINGNHLQAYDAELGEVILTNNHRVVTSRRKRELFETQMKGFGLR
jgi:DNA-binding LytR/AlgR family response regulator